ncbi:general transcription factor II-I repeat domain-containing protein 2B isoform X1 [Cryptotermes secundus]|uniref:general transcription factor II-I repeat domain-containing protein 2B isoform X1 n=1 Tax=Cryptotermes secundus TaxID=105785 RepID=UPI001454C29A|nr:general transcription factor II-I repeat domain-containing protein 2B isoform X1 [Cryptotermes secundus]
MTRSVTNATCIAVLCRFNTSGYPSCRCRNHERREKWTKHSAQYSQLTGKERSQKLETLKQSISLQRSFFTKMKNENKAASKVSLRVAHLLAKEGKPFTDGELKKSCLIVAVEEMCPEKMDLFNNISLSARTVARRAEDIGSNITNQLIKKANDFEWFSLALDELTDITDTAQLLLFIRRVNADFEVTEELASMNSLRGTTTGEDIFKEVEEMLTKYNLKWNQLKCVTTDGGKNMSGTGKCLVGSIYTACENARCTRPMFINCIIHQHVLCGKYLNLSCVLEPVVSTVNFIRSRGLNHRHFRDFLSEVEAEYPDLPYHTAVRWLSSRKVLLRFFELRAEIEIFLNEKKRPQPLLSNTEWLCKLASAADMMGFHNGFNLKLRGKTVLICEIYTAVKLFRRQLALIESQIMSSCFVHFPCCQTVKEEVDSPFPHEFAGDIFSELKKQFQQRFSDLDASAEDISRFENPFNCTIEELPPNLQLEVINLQCDNMLKGKFQENNLTEFYKCLPSDEYGELRSYARGLISVFGSTYLCEKTFSKMKYVKSQYRSALTDEHLQSIMMIGSTIFDPQFEKMLSKKTQFHSSH